MSRAWRLRLCRRFLHGAGILALRILVAIHELDDGERRVVALTEAGFQHARIAAMTGLVARAENIEELADEIDVLDLRDRLTARMQVAALAERHQLFDDRTKVFCLR